MKKNIKLVGHVGVDSGQVMIVDPCYLKDYKDNNFRYRKGVRHISGKQYEVWQVIDGEQITWATPLKEEGGKDMNTLARTEGWEIFTEYPDKGEFSYSGISSATCEDMAAECKAAGSATCVASRTGWGDGNYPVYAEFNEEGRVKSLIIKFM